MYAEAQRCRCNLIRCKLTWLLPENSSGNSSDEGTRGKGKILGGKGGEDG